jgi:hypothetical protein
MNCTIYFRAFSWNFSHTWSFPAFAFGHLDDGRRHVDIADGAEPAVVLLARRHLLLLDLLFALPWRSAVVEGFRHQQVRHLAAPLHVLYMRIDWF